MKNKLLVVGSVALDTVRTRAGEHKDIIGGAATFIALAAGSFCTPQLVGVIGKGAFPAEYLALLRSYGIDLEGLTEEAGRTFRWSGVYKDDFSTRDTLSTELGVFGEFSPKIPATYQDTKYVMLGNIHPAVQLNIRDQVAKDAYVAADTMNLWIDTTPAELNELISRVNLLIINDEEAVMLTGEPQIRIAAQKILARGLDALVIKRGEHGAWLFTKNTTFFTPALPLAEVIDPTGAGDTFAGGLMGHLAKCDSHDDATLKKAMHYGTVMASAQVQGFGADGLKKLDPEAVETRLGDLVALTRVD